MLAPVGFDGSQAVGHPAGLRECSGRDLEPRWAAAGRRRTQASPQALRAAPPPLRQKGLLRTSVRVRRVEEDTVAGFEDPAPDHIRARLVLLKGGPHFNKSLAVLRWHSIPTEGHNCNGLLDGLSNGRARTSYKAGLSALRALCSLCFWPPAAVGISSAGRPPAGVVATLWRRGRRGRGQ